MKTLWWSENQMVAKVNPVIKKTNNKKSVNRNASFECISSPDVSYYSEIKF